MIRLTPAGVSTLMVAVVGLLVTAYFAKLMRAEETRPVPTVEVRNIPISTSSTKPATTIRKNQAAAAVEQPSPVVARGMRGVSIALAPEFALANGLVKAGQYVDVYVTPRTGSKVDGCPEAGMTLTLLRGVKVLATSRGESPVDKSSLVMLELTPDQATLLILAREKGNLALSYNPEGKGDGGIVLKNHDRATIEEVFSRPAPSAVRPFTTEVFRGHARSTQQFEDFSRNELQPAASNPPDSTMVAPLWTRRNPSRWSNRPAPDRMAAAVEK